MWSSSILRLYTAGGKKLKFKDKVKLISRTWHRSLSLSNFSHPPPAAQWGGWGGGDVNWGWHKFNSMASEPMCNFICRDSSTQRSGEPSKIQQPPDFSILWIFYKFILEVSRCIYPLSARLVGSYSLPPPILSILLIYPLQNMRFRYLCLYAKISVPDYIRPCNHRSALKW